MYAQLVHFDGPRSPELIAAIDRAGLERILPTVSSDPEFAAAHVATFVLLKEDGAEAVLVVADTEAALERGNQLIADSTLLPGEDPALLPGPDRTDTYRVVHAFGRHYLRIGSAS